MLRRAGGRRKWPLASIRRKYLPFIPLVAALGLLASLLEGAAVGLLIPLLSVLLAQNPAGGLSGPLRTIAELFSSHDAHSRTILLGAAMLALILVNAIVQSVNECLLASIDARIGRDIRCGMAASLLTVDYRFFLEQDPARLTRIASTDSWFVVQAARSVLSLIPAAARLLVFSVFLALLNLGLFVLVLVGAAAVQTLTYFLERRQRGLSHEFTESNRLLWQRLLTLLQAPRVIRLFGQQAREQDKANAAIERLRRSVRATNYLNAFVHPAVDSLVALLFLSVLLAGYWSGMSIPVITAFLLLMTRAQPHAKAIVRARLGIASFDSSLREVDWLLSRQRVATDSGAPGAGIKLDRPITFEDVRFHYPNGSRALDGVTLTIQPGTSMALLGDSGSGKTSLILLLCRLVEPQSGSIVLGRKPIEQINAAAWRSRIGLAGQDTQLVAGTVAENIAYGCPHADAAEIEAVARAAGADAFIAALPQGLETPVGPQGLNLSGGQRQRIGIARAMLVKPDLLILDEATNAVDALSDREIVRLASEHRNFRTLIIISHRKSTVAACENGIVLANGKVVEAGPLTELDYFKAMAADRSRGESA